MSVSVSVECHIDIPKNLAKVRDDKFWQFAANQWWIYITPYTPMDTGALSETVNIQPGMIEYLVIYANRRYHEQCNLRTDKHPKASTQWDKAAIPTQKRKLIAAMQEYIDSGRLHLNG